MKYSILLTAALIAATINPVASQTFTSLYSFPGGSGGQYPEGVPYIGPAGIVYGGTEFGGTVPCSLSPLGCGVIFSLTPPASPGGSWTPGIVYSFEGESDGFAPESGVMPGPNGTLLGTALQGGTTAGCPKSGCGTFYSLIPPTSAGQSWTQQVLYNFIYGDRYPLKLTLGSDGNYYGVALDGGNKNCSDGCGSIYELAPPAQPGGMWSLATIGAFVGGLSGAEPSSPLAIVNGVLYGTTTLGGDQDSNACAADGCGTAFSLTPPQPPATAWTFRVIHRFQEGPGGFYPYGGLLAGENGTLYGTTTYGGVSTAACSSRLGCGTVFSLTPSGSTESWTETVLYAFQGGNDGAELYGYNNTIVLGPTGQIYGVTGSGGGTLCGGTGCGILFELLPPAAPGGAWTETILHSFSNADGRDPNSAPAIDANGTLYGFTVVGGILTACSNLGCGTVYQYVPAQ